MMLPGPATIDQVTVLATATGAERRTADRPRPRLQPRLALGILTVLIVCFAAFASSRMFPPQSYGLADDWRVFYAAAAVVHSGGSPYDPALIHAAEQSSDHYSVVQPSLDDFANLPIVAWGLQPLTLMSFWVSYALAAALGMAAAGIALYLWLRRWGWRSAGRWTAVALLSWPALLGVFSGQFDLLLLAVLLGGMALSLRRFAGFAGAACMAAALIKPHILWPLPLLVAASQLPDRRAAGRCLAAAAATAAILVGGGEILMPGATRAFLSHLLAFGGRIGAVQPDLAGLPGMVEHLPGSGAGASAVAVLGAAATVGFVCFWAFSGGARALAPDVRLALGVGAGMAIWLLTTPYAHPNDDVLLFPLLGMMVGADARSIRQRDIAWALAGCAALITAFVLSPVAGSIFTVALAAATWRRWAVIGQPGIAAYALVALAILPMVWPFHVVAASLTPLAVLTVAVGSIVLTGRTLRVRAGYSRASAVAGSPAYPWPYAAP
jgi:Glycosyltransferase family 87